MKFSNHSKVLYSKGIVLSVREKGNLNCQVCIKKMNEQVINYASKKAELCKNNDNISPRLYDEYGVKKGLRDENGKGVLAGLTNISKIISSKIIDGKKVSCEGELWYRGYKVEDLINSLGPNELGFEKAAYLLLMGELPSGEELSSFKEVIGSLRTLPSNFTNNSAKSPLL